MWHGDRVNGWEGLAPTSPDRRAPSTVGEEGTSPARGAIMAHRARLLRVLGDHLLDAARSRWCGHTAHIRDELLKRAPPGVELGELEQAPQDVERPCSANAVDAGGSEPTFAPGESGRRPSDSTPLPISTPRSTPALAHTSESRGRMSEERASAGGSSGDSTTVIVKPNRYSPSSFS